MLDSRIPFSLFWKPIKNTLRVHKDKAFEAYLILTHRNARYRNFSIPAGAGNDAAKKESCITPVFIVWLVLKFAQYLDILVS